MNRRLLRPAEAAAAFGVQTSTLRRWADEGLLPVVRTPAGTARYPAAAVEEILRHASSPVGPDPDEVVYPDNDDWEFLGEDYALHPDEAV